MAFGACHTVAHAISFQSNAQSPATLLSVKFLVWKESSFQLGSDGLGG
jgi:hypothetical protein